MNDTPPATPRPIGVLEEMTLEEVRELKPEVVVLPVASTEPHGPHLPYGTDTFRADGVCRRAVTRANERGGRVLMYPTLPIGNNVNFKAFPFACRIRVRTLMNVVLDIIEALEEDGIRKVVLVNSHGGNPDTLQATLREHMERHRSEPDQQGAFVCLVGANALVAKRDSKLIKHPSAHAGESETVQIMYLRPELVRKEKLGEFPVNEPTLPTLREGVVGFVRPWHAFMPESAGGETRTSSEETGRRIIEASADGLAKFLVELSEAPWKPNFPYAT